MSRLATRLVRLEQALGRCPACRSRPTEIQLVTPAQPVQGGREALCPGCGEPVERLAIVLSFEPGLPPPGGRA